MKKLSVIPAIVLLAGSLSAQKQFTNNGNFKIHQGASVSFFGNFINNGAFVDSGQVITLSGTTPQNIGGSSTTSFKNLTLNNTAGSYLTNSEEIIGTLNITAGTFSTTGYKFTLISNSNGTARIAPILGNFAGNITMQRYLGPGASSWRFLASPVSGVTLNDWQDNFITSGFPGSNFPSFNFTSIYTYDETVGGISDYGYNPPASALDPIVPGKGYWCYIGPVPLTVDVTGPPVKFSQTFSVSYTPSGGASEDGYVMIGNPYPSPIDWTSASWTKNKINNAIYIWNAKLQQYASWVAGVSVNGGSNIIASSQSFWVQANGANPSLSCNENIKTSGNPEFFRPSASSSFLASNNLKLNISGNSYTDETVLLFGTGATNGYDVDADARKLFSSNLSVPGISTLDSTLKDMSVNSLPPVNNNIHIPVKTIVGSSGVYTIAIDSSSMMPQDFCIVLEDLVTGVQTNMSNPASYTFFIADTTKAPRFILHVSASHSVGSVSSQCSQSQNGKAFAVAKGIGPWNYVWSSATNANLQTTNNTFSADTLFNLSSGDYSVQITDVGGTCGAYIKTITVTQPLAVYAGFIYSTDTLYTGPTHSLTVQNTATGATAYLWNFGDGTPVIFASAPGAHSYSSPGTYTIVQTAINGACSDTASRIVTVLTETTTVTPVNTVGLANTTPGAGIKVYPNPSKGLFYLALDLSVYQKTVLEVFTLSGQVIYKTSISAHTTEIHLENEARGIYFYRLLLDDQTSLQGKLIND